MNYYDDYLEPFFYTGLNRNRGANGYFPPFHRRVPFLSGELFEELDNYDWRNNNFSIPNEMFSNRTEKGVWNGDGILDIFDRYNFTMSEDEPMEREVAIDPEMLGKVFENLLDVKDRKSKGAFYTPREIVHYMCQESLINYLVTRSGIPEEDIRKLVVYGEYFKESDIEKIKKVIGADGKAHYELDKQRDLEIPESIFSFKKNVNRIKELDDLLTNVKVVDPATGSGAFPLGMLNEIVKTREILTSYMMIEMNGFERLSFYSYGRKPYDLKINTIRNCIFACDIEPSAVDITKLRFYLSLVIDDHISDKTSLEFDEHTQPKPLPNLECNIICGNSLIDEFEGRQLITKSDFLNNAKDNYQMSIAQYAIDPLIEKLIDCQSKYFYAQDHNEKENLKEAIQKIYDQIIYEQIKDSPDLVNDYNEAKNLSSKPFVLWELNFPEVFNKKKGFDIAIGNPPYVLLQDKVRNEKELEYYRNEYEVAKYKVDLYHLFIEKSVKLLNNNGTVALITPSNFTTNNYCADLRKFMLTRLHLIDLVFYGDNVFQANVNNLVFVGEIKEKDTNEELINIEERDKKDGDWIVSEKKSVIQSSFMNDDYIINPSKNESSDSILEIIQRDTVPLSDISNINFGMQLRYRKVYKNDVTKDINTLTEYHTKCYTGKDISEYVAKYSGLYCYFNEEAKCGGCWDRKAQFACPKLLVRQIGRVPVVGIDENGYAVLNTAFMISGFKNDVSPYYLLGLLNSVLMKYYWINKFSDNRKQFPKIKGTYLGQLPIRRDVRFESLVQEKVKEILTNYSSQTQESIDELIFDMYGLNGQEKVEIREYVSNTLGVN